MQWLNIDGKFLFNLAYITEIRVVRPNAIRLYQNDDLHSSMTFFVEEDDIDWMLNTLGQDDSGTIYLRTVKSDNGEEV